MQRARSGEEILSDSVSLGRILSDCFGIRWGCDGKLYEYGRFCFVLSFFVFTYS